MDGIFSVQIHHIDHRYILVTARTSDRVTTGVEMSIPSNIVEVQELLTGLTIYNSSLGRMK
jgi:hypothetical protein